jgi:hypothetical protein
VEHLTIPSGSTTFLPHHQLKNRAIPEKKAVTQDATETAKLPHSCSHATKADRTTHPIPDLALV